MFKNYVCRFRAFLFDQSWNRIFLELADEDAGALIKAVLNYAEGKNLPPENSTLNAIYSVLTGKTIHEAELEFEGKGYGDFKLAVGQVVADSLKPIRDDFARLSKEKTYLEELIAKGAETAYKVSNRTLSKAKRKVGLI